ncbi:MAG: SLBB domain-containing protein, partial [Bacteroidota bacterium]
QAEDAVTNAVGEETLDYFGYDTFRLADSTAQPLVTIPVADDGYVVGPGDELRLTVTGDAEFQLDLTVDPEGRVFIPTVGQYTAAGQPIGQLRERLRGVLGRSYAGLLTNPASTFMDLTLRRLQAVQVFVTGAVRRPGGYTVPSGTSVFNALYLVGGPTLDGSLRRIRVVRNGQTIATVDAYDYLLEGRDSQPVRLQNGDRVFVPPRGTTVGIEGAVRRSAFYEMRNAEENVATLLDFAGGLEADAYAARFQIDRIVPFVERRDPSIARTVRDLSLVEVLRGTLAVTLADGDRVRIFSILEAEALASRAAVPAASIEGAVFQPGRYELGQTVRTVRDLIDEADGLRGDAYQARAELLRFREDLDRAIVRIDLTAALADDPQHNLVLRPGDVVRVYARADLEVEREVRIVGRVRDPGTYPLYDGMTLFDLLFQGGGLADEEYVETVLLERADLFRPTDDGLRERILRFDLGETLRGAGLADLPLEPGDEVRVYERVVEEQVADPFVLVSGAVASPGRYRLRENMTVEDAILQAGGYAEGALENRVEVTRMTERSTGRRAETREVIVQSDGLFGSDTIENGHQLQHRDRIYVRLNPDFQVQQTVVLSGEVLFPGQYTLQRDNRDIEYEGYFPNASLGGGFEIGYQWRPELAVGVAYHFGRYDAMRTAPSPVNPADLVAFNSTADVHEAQLRLRYTLFPQARISPFTTLGAAVALRSPATVDDDGDVGWAPLLGAGLDIKLTPRFALIADLDVRLFFPDAALDGANFGFNPGRIRPASASRDDNADFDVLSHIGLGLRYTFKSPVIPVDVTITGPDTLFVNELGTFTGDYNRDATPPLDFAFDLGDGTLDADVLRTSHAYPQPGTYTVSFTGTGPINSDVASKPVVVVERPTQAPVLADCSTLPREAVLLGEAVRFFAQVQGTEPLSYSYDFGDGTTSAQPSPSHTYAAAGVYTATLTVTNVAGSATCTFQIIVTDPFCDEVSELNTVFYDS